MATRKRPHDVTRFLEFLKSVERIDLTNEFVFLQLMVRAMQTRFRWDKRTRPHLKPESRAKGRQLYRENILEHCFKTAWLAAEMMAIAKAQGIKGLNFGRIVFAGLIHDIAELFRGDKYYWERTAKHVRQEQQGFRLIASKLPEAARKRFLEIYSITQPPVSKPIARWTREQRFFKLVELVGYFKRTLAECRAGNLNFAPVLGFHWSRGDHHDPLVFRKEFSDVFTHYFTKQVIEEIEKFMANATGGVSG